MKKLLIASIVMLATLTACNNSNDEMISTPVGKEKIESKVTAREEVDLHYSESEIEFLEKNGFNEIYDEYSTYAIQAVEDYIRGNVSSRKITTQILCHGNYSDQVSWTYVKVINDGEVFYRLVRRWRTETGALTTVYEASSTITCDSILFL